MLAGVPPRGLGSGEPTQSWQDLRGHAQKARSQNGERERALLMGRGERRTAALQLTSRPMERVAIHPYGTCAACGRPHGAGQPSHGAASKAVGMRGRGGQSGKETSRRQCAKHQGHLGEEGESSFCKRNNICGVGAEHL